MEEQELYNLLLMLSGRKTFKYQCDYEPLKSGGYIESVSSKPDGQGGSLDSDLHRVTAQGQEFLSIIRRKMQS